MIWRSFILFFIALSAFAEPSTQTLLYENDIYKIFEVDRKAPDKEAAFKSSYRQLMKRFHPDQNKGNAEAEEIAKRINALMDQLKRNQFKPELVRVTPYSKPGAKTQATPPPRAQTTPRPSPRPTPNYGFQGDGKAKADPGFGGFDFGAEGRSFHEDTYSAGPEPGWTDQGPEGRYTGGTEYTQEDTYRPYTDHPEGRFYETPTPPPSPQPFDEGRVREEAEAKWGQQNQGTSHAEAAKAYRETSESAEAYRKSTAKPVDVWLGYEGAANAALRRDLRSFPVEHLEIPLSVLSSDFAKDFDPKIQQALLFTAPDGTRYVRWVLHPDDRKYGAELESRLRAGRVPFKRGQRFLGRYTASRSLVLEDPESGVSFSAKVSTSNAGGNWSDKKQTGADAMDIRAQDKYLSEALAAKPAKNFVVMRDVGAVMAPGVDQAMVIRSLEQVQGNKTYLPAFSALHEDVGRQIARQNGSINPTEFWRENLVKPLARAMAELSAEHGMSFESSHSQQFLVEMENGKPTGRIMFRDMGDVFLQKEFFEGRRTPDLLKNWEAKYITEKRMDISLSLFNGTPRPSWVSEADAARYAADFFQEFEQEFGTRTGVSGLKAAPLLKERATFYKEYSNEGPEWQKHFTRRAGFTGSCPNWFKGFFGK